MWAAGVIVVVVGVGVGEVEGLDWGSDTRVECGLRLWEERLWKRLVWAMRLVMGLDRLELRRLEFVAAEVEAADADAAPLRGGFSDRGRQAVAGYLKAVRQGSATALKKAASQEKGTLWATMGVRWYGGWQNHGLDMNLDMDMDVHWSTAPEAPVTAAPAGVC